MPISSPSSRRLRSLRTATGLAAAAVVLLSACGSPASEKAADQPSSNEISAELQPYLEPPTSVGTDVALSARPEAGKTIAVLTCNISSCRSYLDATKEAAALLDWEVKPFLFDPTPEEILSQMKAAIASKPDGIMINGQDSSIWRSAIAEAEAAGVPIVSQGSTDVVGGPIIATGTSSAHWDELSGILGSFIASDSGGEAKMLSYGLAPFKISMQIAESVAASLTDACADCEVEVVPAQATAIGSGIPQDVVSRLQQDPEIDYVSFADGAMTPGVVAALREAGLSDSVRIVGLDAQGPDYESMMKGEAYAFVQFSVPTYAWQGVDALARHVVGDPQVEYTMPTQILTKETIGEETAEEVLVKLPRDIVEQYTALWQVK